MSATIRNLCAAFTMVVFVFSGVVQAQHIQWAKSVEEARARAAAENKVVQLHFGATWCGPCRQLESFVFPVAEVADKMNQNVVAVKIDIDQEKNLARQYDIRTVPQDVFLGPNGEILHRQVSPRGSDNYCRMLDTALKFAAHTTRQSQMAAQAVASIGRQQAAAVNQSVFMDAEAAKAGNANQVFAGHPQAGQTGVLPPAIAATSAALATNELKKSQEMIQASLQSQFNAPEFQKSEFPAAELPAPKNVFGNAGAAQTVTNPNVPSTPALSQSPLPSMPTSPQLPSSLTPPALPQPDAQINAAVEASIVANQHLNNGGLPQAVASTVGTDPMGQASAIASTDNMPTNAVPASAHVEPTPVAPMVAPTLGLDGYCPVSLLNHQQWVKGNPAYGRIHRGKVYLFASQEMAEAFFAQPDQLSPALAGFDPVEFANSGKLIEGQRKYGVFCETNGGLTIVLFSNEANRDAFKADREAYLQQIRVATMAADRN